VEIIYGRLGGGKGGAGSPSALRPLGMDWTDGNRLLEFLTPKASKMVKLNRIKNPTEMKPESILFMDNVLLRPEENPSLW